MGVLTFDRPDSSANVFFDPAVLAELNAHLTLSPPMPRFFRNTFSSLELVVSAERASKPGKRGLSPSVPTNELESGASADQLRGLVLTSAKNSIFIAGADSLWPICWRTNCAGLIELGQSVFSRSLLAKPTVAAIHGPVWRRLRTCTACDYRLASPTRSRESAPSSARSSLPAAYRRFEPIALV